MNDVSSIATAAEPRGEVPRRIGPTTAAAVVVASTLGTGIFTTTGILVDELGSATAVLAAWGAGGLLALCGALSYAELAAALPRNGGEYQLLGRIYRPAFGFVAGIVSLLAGFSAPLAASALAFGRYVATVAPAVAPVRVAVALVLVLAIAHVLPVRLGGRIQIALALLEIVLVLGFATAGIRHVDLSRLLAPAPEIDFTAPAFATALIYVSFAYSGWNAAIYLAGEVKDPGRALPRALVIGTILVMVLYLALNVVFLGAAPRAEIAGTVEIGHVAAARLFGPGAARVVAVLVAVILAGSVSAMLMTGPRVYETMGLDYPRLAFLARGARAGGPVAATAVQAAIAIAMIVTSSFAAILVYIGFTLSIVAALAVFGVVVLRWREPNLPRAYRVPGYPLTPLAFVALSLWMALHALVRHPASSWAGVATVAAALAVHRLVARRGPRSPPSADADQPRAAPAR